MALIREFEGFRATVYADPVGVPTIGYGHRVQVGETWGTVTEDEALALLARDLAPRIAAVKACVGVPLDDEQKAALYSFVYNVGIRAFKTSALLEKINRGDMVGAAEEFCRWRYAKGVELPGLVRRRARERALFLTHVGKVTGSWTGE